MKNHPTEGGVPTEFTVDLTEEDYESVSNAVVRVIAEHVGAEPENMDPFAESIDPEALDALFESADSDARSNLKEITFRYQGVVITVSGAREIRFRPPQPHLLNW